MKKRSSFSYYSKFNSDSSDSDSSDSDSSDSDSYIKNNVKKKINIPHKKKENKPKLNDKEEKEIFKSIEKEQSKELMELLSSIASNNLNLQQAKQKIIEGVINFEQCTHKKRTIGGIHATTKGNSLRKTTAIAETHARSARNRTGTL